MLLIMSEVPESIAQTKWLIAIAFLVHFGCGQPSGADVKGDTVESAMLSYAEYLKKGRDASNSTQGVLLANIGSAIQRGGPEYAVRFCNVNAMPIVDSLSSAAGMKIGRISTRNRNPGNNIKSHEDRRAWKYFANNKGDGAASDTVLYDRAQKAVYYKPIHIGMETCLKCHGSRSQDIDLATLEKIDELYPTDNAVNYSMGELRGLWKVEF
jgi:uncharacterized protein DUF3365